MVTRLTVVIILPHIQILKHIVYLSINVSCMCVSVLVTQLCPTLSDFTDCGPPGSSAHGILQAGILECVDISFSKGSS